MASNPVLTKRELSGVVFYVHPDDNLIFLLIKYSSRLIVMYIYFHGQVLPRIIIVWLISNTLLFVTKKLERNLHRLMRRQGRLERQESLNGFRKDLRQYWELKREADRCTKLFILIWLICLMFIGITFFSKVAISLDDYSSEKVPVVCHIIATLAYIIIMIALLLYCDYCDRMYEDLVHRASSVVGLKNILTEENGDKLGDELYLLHHELSNRPDTRFTVYGMFSFDRCLLLSFISATINFYVMTIQIRVSNK